LPLKRKIASRESENHKNFATAYLFSVFVAVSRTTTSGLRNAIRAKPLAANFQRVKTPAPLARRFFIDRNGWFNLHNF
jgi:hypothetical protein